MDAADKMIRTTVKNLPKAGDSKEALLTFIEDANMEFHQLRRTLNNDPEREELFVSLLVRKLPADIAHALRKEAPTTYAQFISAVVANSSNIKSIHCIQTEAQNSIQRPEETALGFIKRLEDLSTEYKLALLKENLPAAQYTMDIINFDTKVLSYAPKAITDIEAGLLARQSNCQTLTELKNILRKEHDRVTNIKLAVHTAADTINPSSNAAVRIVEEKLQKLEEKMNQIPDQILALLTAQTEVSTLMYEPQEKPNTFNNVKSYIAVASQIPSSTPRVNDAQRHTRIPRENRNTDNDTRREVYRSNGARGFAWRQKRRNNKYQPGGQQLK